MKEFDDYKNKFSDLFQAVIDIHQKEGGNRGHGIDHDVTTAQIALQIAPNEVITEKGWVASIIHSTDRIEGAGDFKTIINTLLEYIPPNTFKDSELEEIRVAVLHHAEKVSEPYNEVHEILQDADKLANLMMGVVIRGGQFRPDIAPFEFNYLDRVNPESTYTNPKSVLDAIRLTLSEYKPLIRLPKAKILADKFYKNLEWYIQKIEEEHELLGLKGKVF